MGLTGEERAAISKWNHDMMWLETIISKALGVRVAIKRVDGYWHAYNPAIGEHRVTDLLKGVNDVQEQTR